MTHRGYLRAVVALAFLALAPAAMAQSAISGVVRDPSGGILPGVAVEASSPALIEKVRTVVTDDQGVYRIVDLRPGTYTVVFSLSGFSTVRREGVELPASFTATINAELQVGNLAESITVSGTSPLVDVQNVTQRSVLSNTLTDALPSSRLVQGYVSYLPGVTGTTLGVVGLDTRVLAIHGNRSGELTLAIDGYSTNFTSSFTGVSSSFFINQAISQETNVQTAGATADQEWGGIVSNIIPKEGGNSLSGALYASYSNEGMQATNLTDELRAKGLTSVNRNRLLYDVNPGLGGRIVRDKAWFFGSYRQALVDRWRAGVYYDTDPLDWVYTPDLTRLHHSAVRDYDYNLRLTLQPTPRNKFLVFFDQQPHFVDQRNADGNQSSTFAPEATNYTSYWPNVFYNAAWKSPVSSKLLLEAGANVYAMQINPRMPRDPEVPFGTISALESATNVTFRASGLQSGFSAAGYMFRSRMFSSRASVSYIPGSHAFKAGMQMMRGNNRTSRNQADYAVTLLNGVPRSLTEFAMPVDAEANATDLGLFAQDQWTMSRATLSYGLRFDYVNGYVPAQSLPAGRFVPARSFPARDNVPLYKDLSPRIGVSYDLFGDGKTAVKGTVNRYVVGSGVLEIPYANNPVTLSVQNVNRNWNDANGDFVPDCDLANPLANGECAQVADLNFGKANPRNLGHNPNLLTGWGVRAYDWEVSAQLQREITNAVSANVGYFRRWYGNFTTTDNLAVTPADYTGYCVTAPSNSQLPGGGGYPVCDLYDINPSKFGQVQNQVNAMNDYGGQTETWNGVDVTINARLPRGASLNGGVSTGRLHTVTCAVVDLPTVQFCDTVQPYQTQVKFLGRYPLPWYGIELSGVYQNVPGPNLLATAVYTNAQIRGSLGRDLSSGANGTVTVNLIAPNTVYLPRQNQVDMRVAKAFQVDRYKFTAGLDLFNLFNGSGIQRYNNRVNATWPTPQDIQPARSIALNGQLSF